MVRDIVQRTVAMDDRRGPTIFQQESDLQEETQWHGQVTVVT
jgi:hypothetical protein